MLCPSCWPTKRKNHGFLYLDHYLRKFSGGLDWIIDGLTGFGKSKRYDWWPDLLVALSRIKIIRFHPEVDETQLFNRTLIFIKEAKRRGIRIEGISLLGRYSNEFRFAHAGRWHHFEGIPLLVLGSCGALDDKNLVKQTLKKNGVPIAEGRAFSDPRKAFAFGQALGFPLVTKPNAGSLSHHVTCNIRTEDDLRRGIAIAKQYQPVFIVERYVPGSLFRASVIGQTHVFVCQKDPANVVGDWTSTIEELINRKNADPKRGETHQKNTTLHRIPVDDMLTERLAHQNLSLASVLPNGQKVYLQEKFILSQGCDIVALTNETHPDNMELFKSIAALFDTHLVGIDFICQDIRQSWKNQPCAVLETNSLPYVDMHQEPSHGEPDPVAEIVWDVVLKNVE